MSLEGLIKALLYQVLTQMPELILTVFPHRVEAGIMFGYHIWQFEPWTRQELLKGFEKMIAEATQKAKLIFLIDGLDEFDGMPGDHVDLVHKMIRPRLKLCVSSRPWIAFEDAFRGKPHLQLEDLTFNDIRTYVTLKMNENPAYKVLQEGEPEFSSKFIDSITEKASGVFLWVYLVTRSLLSGLSEGERLGDLQKRLDALPQGLENLFHKILETLTPEYFKEAAQLFQIMEAALTLISLLYLSWAEEQDKDYAIKQPLGPLTARQAYSRAEFMRRRLTANCRGAPGNPCSILESAAERSRDIPAQDSERLPETDRKFVQDGCGSRQQFQS